MSFVKDLQKAAESALREGSKAAKQAGRKVGQVAHDNRGKIDAAIDKAGKVVDDKTGGKYSSTIANVKAQATKGVDLVERQRTKAGSAGTGGAEAASTPTDGPQDSRWEGTNEPGNPDAYDASRDAAAAKPDPGVGEFGTATGEPGKNESGTSTP